MELSLHTVNLKKNHLFKKKIFHNSDAAEGGERKEAILSKTQKKSKKNET